MSELLASLASHPSVDPAALNELKAFQDEGDDDIVAELIGIFLDDCPGRLESIRHGVENDDAAEIASAAHALKSSSAQLGALRMSAICQMLESDGKAGKTDNAAELSSELLDEFERVRQQFSADD